MAKKIHERRKEILENSALRSSAFRHFISRSVMHFAPVGRYKFSTLVHQIFNRRGTEPWHPCKHPRVPKAAKTATKTNSNKASKSENLSNCGNSIKSLSLPLRAFRLAFR